MSEDPLSNPSPAPLPTAENLRCPRCGYDLRGLAAPRCPECGLGFTVNDLASGLVRHNVPAPLDRTDRWQPHLVLGHTLLQLLTGLLRLRRLFRTVDLHGPTSAAWLMLIVGTGWLWLLSGLLCAVGIFRAEPVSPALALRTGLAWWAPQLVLLGHLTAALLVLPLLTPRTLGQAPLQGHHALRLCGYLLPSLSGWTCLLGALLLCAVPEFPLAERAIWPMPAVLIALVAFRPWRWIRAGERVRQLGSVVLAAVVAAAAARVLLPPTLRPPLWLYG